MHPPCGSLRTPNSGSLSRLDGSTILQSSFLRCNALISDKGVTMRKEPSTFGLRYFSRSPLQSYHFWLNTIFLAMVASEAAYYVTCYCTVLGTEAAASMAFPVLVVAALWFRVLLTHRKVHNAFFDSQDPETMRNRWGTEVLYDLAYLCYAGLGLALFAIGSLYASLGRTVLSTATR
jgi:hypothetical protein